jgi:hypothetical protein
MIDAYPKTWDEEIIKAVEKIEEEEEQSRMKVYIVMYDDGGNAYVEAVYSDRAKIPKKYLGSMIYDIDEWEVKEEEES